MRTPKPTPKTRIQKRNFNSFEKDEFNAAQNKLYKETIFGLSIYTKEEQKALPLRELQRIDNAHQKAQIFLNLWKQQLCNSLSNKVFKTFFPKSKITKDLLSLSINDVESSFISKVDFKYLKIHKKDIINKLIKEKILPENFFEIK